MAIKATIYKAELAVSDMDRHYYQTHTLTIARHPSETDERMMARLLAYALNADERLEFTKGLCADDEPELWQKSFSGDIELWVDFGQPDEKRIRKACGRAQQVIIYCYNHRSAEVWWQQNEHKLQRYKNLKIVKLADEVAEQLAALAERTMRLQCSLQDGDCWISSDASSVHVGMDIWKAPN